MVPLLAKNAVWIKCGFPNAVMTGNYECAYALGVLEALIGMEHEQELFSLADIHKKVLLAAAAYKPEKEEEKRLLAMLTEYEPALALDDQMKELYDVGFADKSVGNEKDIINS